MLDPATHEVKVERTHEEDARYLLRKMALDFTKEGTLEAFAVLIGKHPTTISAWMTAGDVPEHAARHLQNRFGFNAPAARLCLSIREKRDVNL